MSLDISDCPDVTDDALYALARGSTMLQFLNLSDCSGITDAGIKELVCCCTELSTLSLSRCNAATDELLQSISRFCSKLSTLLLSGCEMVSNAGVGYITCLPKLEVVSLHCCDLVTADAIEDLCLHCPGIRQGLVLSTGLVHDDD